MRKLCVASLLIVLPAAACGSDGDSDPAETASATQASGTTDDSSGEAETTENESEGGGTTGQETEGGTTASGSASASNSDSASTTESGGNDADGSTSGGETVDPTTGGEESSTGEVPTSGPGVLPGETGFDSMCRRAMECGSTYYSDAQECMDAGIDYWGTCAEVTAALDNFGACMSEMACEDYNPDAYNPNSTPCADLYGELQDAGPC